MFHNRAITTTHSIETSGIFAGYVFGCALRYSPCFLHSLSLIFLCIAFACNNGCHTLSLPAIDPTGNKIFASGPNGYTNIVSPHDPNNGYPSNQPAFQTPPAPPACMQGNDGTEKKLCKGCLAGKSCLGKRKEAEEVRGRCGQLLLTPTRIVAPVGGEVILLAGVCGKDEYLVTNEPIEWMLSPKSVGEFVEVGDDAKGQRRSIWKKDNGPKVEKLGVDFARGRTSREAGNITRGTASKDDDLPIRMGQTWISLTSPSEGVSKVTGWDLKGSREVMTLRSGNVALATGIEARSREIYFESTRGHPTLPRSPFWRRSRISAGNSSYDSAMESSSSE